MAPAFSGIHHLKFPVGDLPAGIAWFESALGATRLGHLDHLDRDGRLFAVILQLPGLDVLTELRLAPEAAAGAAGYDPVTFGAADRAALDAWGAHFDALGVPHSPVISGFAGELIELQTPDGIAIRIYTDPAGPLAEVRMHPEQADFDNPRLNAPAAASSGGDQQAAAE